MSDVMVETLPPMGMVTLRGAPDALTPVLEAIGSAMPERRMRLNSDVCAVLWMSPDELLLTCAYDDAPALATRVTDLAGRAYVTAVVVSDARVAFRLTGSDVADVLAALTPTDLSALAPTEVRRTRLAQVAAAIWRQDDDGGGWRVLCFRSVADYVARLLTNAARGAG